jgi:predicted transcriptional regulator with HTH domain
MYHSTKMMRMMSMANTEIQYVKNRIAKLEEDFGAFASILIQAGIVEVKEENGKQVYKIIKVANG